MSLPATTELDTTEAESLRQLEARVESGLGNFIDVGEALSAIRDQRLYRTTHGTFEEYCRDRWKMSRPRAYQFIQAAEVVSTIVDKSQIRTETQARELANVEPAKRAGVIDKARATTGGKVTAAAIREASRPEPTSDALAATPQSSPSPEKTPTPAPKEQAGAAAPVSQVWSILDAIETVRASITGQLAKAPEPMVAELKKALMEECGRLCGALPQPAKGKAPVSVERQIYDAYPRKVAPKAALKAITAALKACANEEPSAAAYLLERTVKFAEAVAKWPARDHKFIPHPATWFNRGSYADDPSEWQRGTALTATKPTDYSKF